MAQVSFSTFFFLLRGIESHDLVELGPCLGPMAFERRAWGEENLYYRKDDLPSFQALVQLVVRRLAMTIYPSGLDSGRPVGPVEGVLTVSSSSNRASDELNQMPRLPDCRRGCC
ncbi:hypothetical protein M441DRAFT_369051 [Trichoderma asperellum CBS 433.97]|uniref:Uncharacterized protein n=1 Tax=Trichoderma asperellum (strain ATCC 204424 / CBS 433.97 / NBRC 101777) TaxID=1042311 RepID=A0A2T3ZEP9_TRIA4|nr:hypothetical protein M441DRAFT_369051 [Trichoderma asperellum CBS 433.97]PTB43269.1 hypothetical protein M441DRAFT_369051 [Trichoderma asperellum CBS 433.97]